MSKKLPSNSNENGIVGKPAEPTVDPGGRPAAADCVAGTPVEGAGVVDELEAGVLELEEPEAGGVVPLADATAAAWAAAGAAEADDEPVASSLIERKSMCDPVEMW